MKLVLGVLVAVVVVSLSLSAAANDEWSGQCETSQWPKKGPYLLFNGDPTEMVILWQLPYSEQCRITWRAEGSSALTGSASVMEYGTDHQYKATMTGLKPGDRYRYEIFYGEHSFTCTFFAAPDPASGEVRFLGWADTQWAKTEPGKLKIFQPAMLRPWVPRVGERRLQALRFQALRRILPRWVSMP